MTAYIKLSTNEYPRHIGDIEIDPIGSEDFEVVQWVDPPQYDTKIQTCSEGQPVKINGAWQMTWVVRDMTQEEILYAGAQI
jgi:hypothetical protein